MVSDSYFNAQRYRDNFKAYKYKDQMFILNWCRSRANTIIFVSQRQMVSDKLSLV